MQKFQGKYRIETARAQWWNYSNDGDYFITICTKNREHLFGYIQDYEMILNEYGQIVSDCWYDLPKHYHNIVLGEFQIMPNHIHCIVGVDNSRIINPDPNPDSVETGFKPDCTITDANPECVNDSNPDDKIHGVFEFMRALKSFSSRRINEKRNSKGVSNWQERFHDHIIRNEAEYNRIRNYIINNPKNWNKDCFFSSDT
jgi:putative transposase